jgi:hypothetical protein
MNELPFAFVWWDGQTLAATKIPGGRRLGLDRRCLDGDPVQRAWAHVCAVSDHDAVVEFDQPEIQQLRRDALAWWLPLLGNDFICLSTFRVDSVHFAGAVTVARSAHLFEADPFARIYPGTAVEQSLLCPVLPPAGPVIERTAGAPWPGGRFP